MKTEYAIIETLNGNLRLKEASKTKLTEYVQDFIYAESLEDAKEQFKQYKKELRETGLI
jgi:hypothetical protein